VKCPLNKGEDRKMGSYHEKHGWENGVVLACGCDCSFSSASTTIIVPLSEVVEDVVEMFEEDEATEDEILIEEVVIFEEGEIDEEVLIIEEDAA